jgi:hypothetical protein
MSSIECNFADHVSAARMEHRWGRRQPTDIAVCVIGKLLGATATGRVLNISLTGAYLETTAALRVHALVYLETSGAASAAGSSRRHAASVVRRDATGVGLEWCESPSERPSVDARISILAGADIDESYPHTRAARTREPLGHHPVRR